MKWDMTTPCGDCPFRREGGIPLTRPRIREIAGMMLDRQGGTFPCHKTVDYDDDTPQADKSSQHCAGALAFALKHANLPQVARIAERLRLFDGDAILEASGTLVWDSVGQWLKHGSLKRGRRPLASTCSLPASGPDAAPSTEGAR